MTKQQVRDTVHAMNIPDADKILLEKRALAGAPDARFVVFAAFRKQQAAK